MGAERANQISAGGGKPTTMRGEVSLAQVEDLSLSVNSSVQELEALIYSQLGYPPSGVEAVSGGDRIEPSDRLEIFHIRLLAINNRLVSLHHRLSTRLMG